MDKIKVKMVTKNKINKTVKAMPKVAKKVKKRMDEVVLTGNKTIKVKNKVLIVVSNLLMTTAFGKKHLKKVKNKEKDKKINLVKVDNQVKFLKIAK